MTDVDIDAPRGRLRISTWEGVPKLPVLSAAGPGPYPLRVHVRDGGAAARSVSGVPIERHPVLVLPGAAGKTKIHNTAGF